MDQKAPQFNKKKKSTHRYEDQPIYCWKTVTFLSGLHVDAWFLKWTWGGTLACKLYLLILLLFLVYWLQHNLCVFVLRVLAYSTSFTTVFFNMLGKKGFSANLEREEKKPREEKFNGVFFPGVACVSAHQPSVPAPCPPRVLAADIRGGGLGHRLIHAPHSARTGTADHQSQSAIRHQLLSWRIATVVIIWLKAKSRSPLHSDRMSELSVNDHLEGILSDFEGM